MVVNGGDDPVRVGERERSRGGERPRVREMGKRPLGVSVARPDEPASRRKQELARARRPRAPGLLARGRGCLARPAGWAALLGRWAAR